MTFDIKDKVALVTGGASGIGLLYVKELLRNGAKGITIGDVNESYGEKALNEITEEFGPNKAIFVKLDVTDKAQYESAFEKTVETFAQIDILVNNAGILNDAIWEKQIQININGTIYGILLALDKYLPKYKSGEEAVIANVASIVGVDPFPSHPIYSSTKFAVIGLSRAFGDEYHYNLTKVRTVTMCPGVTNTPLISEIAGRSLGPRYEEFGVEHIPLLPPQEPIYVAKGLIKIITQGKTGSVWVAEGGKEAYELHYGSREEIGKK